MLHLSSRLDCPAVLMGRWTLLILFLRLILHVSSRSEFSVQNVDVKKTAILQCNGTVSKDTRPQEYDVEWKTEKNIQVAHYQQGELTVGEWFKGRVSIFKDDIGFGNFSLKISPVEYSDGDLYMCFWRRKHICDVKLDVLVPSMVSAQLGEPATLPCYVHVDKTQKNDVDTVHWKKNVESILDYQPGLFNKSSGCENRCSMSVDKIKFGDLSLTISEVHYSDRGTYQCFTDKTVKPEEIIFTTEVHHNTPIIQIGQSLSLQLYSSEPVRVVFQPNENLPVVPVCTVKGESVDCMPQYKHRVSVQNTTLKLDSVMLMDRGVYRVIDHKTNENISVTDLHTEDPPAPAGNTWPWVLLVLVLVVLVVLVVVLGVKMRLKRCSFCTQRQPFLQCWMRNQDVSQEDAQHQRKMGLLGSPQPVQQNAAAESPCL
ncbi:uncharacterized protein LOC125720607 isoform X2 [Brienomyrus brachyistius]|uniref:uncharacterized protein LOC125720607 isoform X2 n=1 Tax=Brienomyrus brachyistius TaxID=42636 RepID=UPI0020B3A824|nr:uncharacterized protein LOC125720607 isoform X2 [Brienomyrus brachyistius]